MRATGGAAAEALEGDSVVGGVVDGGGVPLRRTGGVMWRKGIKESSERTLRGGLRMLRCMFRLRNERFACGTYLASVRLAFLEWMTEDVPADDN